MRYLILALLFTGCATQQVTLDNLMRASYLIGCGEARLKYIQTDGKPHNAQVDGIINLCEEQAKKFDLRKTGLYQDDMEIFVRRNEPRERRR
jgi:hypothetical protein